jgi:hypothetical protein
MKAFLLAGAVLMTGASIYGFIDYKRTSRSKEFRDLYKETPAPAVVRQPLIETKTTKDATKPQGYQSKKKMTGYPAKTVSTPVVDETKSIAGKEKMTINPVETVKTEGIGEDKVEAKSISIKKKKRINAKMFSRAAPRDVEIEKPSKKSQ